MNTQNCPNHAKGSAQMIRLQTRDIVSSIACLFQQLKIISLNMSLQLCSESFLDLGGGLNYGLESTRLDT